MSASSCWVTCGIVTQLRVRFGAESCWMRVSGTRSTSPNLAKSTFGHGGRSRPRRAGAAAGAAAAGRFAAARTSSFGDAALAAACP